MAVRWGILGTGGIAETFTRDLFLNGLDVAAVGSRTPCRAAEFAGRLGIPRAHGSYAELVADPDVDVVYVATPMLYHHRHAALALDAGKHVLLEKPFTTSAAQAEDLVDRARSAGVVLMEAMWTRFLPHLVRLRELIRIGALGDILTVYAEIDRSFASRPDHRLNDVAFGGGALYDIGVYPISLAVDLLGVPSHVHSFGVLGSTGVDRQVALIGEHEGGAESLLHASLDGKGPVRATVVGTLQRVEMDQRWYEATSYTRYDVDDAVVERFERPQIQGRGVHFQALEIESLIGSGRRESTVMPLAQSVEIVRIMERASARIGVIYPSV